jgi:hypothetical protein
VAFWRADGIVSFEEQVQVGGPLPSLFRTWADGSCPPLSEERLGSLSNRSLMGVLLRGVHMNTHDSAKKQVIFSINGSKIRPVQQGITIMKLDDFSLIQNQFPNKYADNA